MCSLRRCSPERFSPLEYVQRGPVQEHSGHAIRLARGSGTSILATGASFGRYGSRWVSVTSLASPQEHVATAKRVLGSLDTIRIHALENALRRGDRETEQHMRAIVH